MTSETELLDPEDFLIIETEEDLSRGDNVIPMQGGGTKKARKTAGKKATVDPADAADLDQKPAKLDDGMRGQKRMASRFARHYRRRYMWTPGRGWLEFNGSFWEDCPEARPWNSVHVVSRAALDELSSIADSAERDALFSDVRSCDQARTVRGIMDFVQRWPGMNRSDKELDDKPGLFVTLNGTYDLYSNQFRASDPRDLITLAGGSEYDPAATCPLYDSLMELYQPDPEVRDYLHRLAGAAMEGRQNLQHLVTWFGETGGNGKGTIMRAWQKVFGAYFKVMPVEALINRKGADQYRDEKAQLKGARLVWTTEPGPGQRFDTGVVKSITGGDTVSARAVYKAAIEFPPTWLILMSTNNRVATPDDGGMARRLKEVGWNFTVTRGQERNDIDGILASESAGILNRIIGGWIDYQAHGIRHPESVEASTAEYLASVDPLTGFLDEIVEHREGAQIQSSALYRKYVQYCEDEGQFKISNKLFSAFLQKKGYKKDKVHGNICWFGITAG